MDLSTVKWLQIEASSKCNAWCPGCSRNNGGFGLADTFTVEDLASERLEEVLQMFPNLETADFCGTFGDAIAAANIIEQTEIAMRHAPEVLLRTNGSLRNEDWWRDYAKLLSGHRHNVWFCIDGLEDTHHLYRQGTDYHKILANAQAFINAGGTATWQFIPWAHNEHQIKDCIRLSQRLGFKKFELIKRVRHVGQARHWRTGEPYSIKPWSRDRVINILAQEKQHVDASGCMHLTMPSMYLNANGTLNVCCFFNIHHAHRDPDQLLDVPSILSRADPPKTCVHFCGSV